MGAGQFCGGIHAKAGKGDRKGAERGKTLPEGQPATLYEALVKDYTGRTPEAQSQTLVITHLNKDRRALNSSIHDARRENGETGKEEITLPVLVTSNIRDGELRKLSTWTAHKEAVALVDNVYHRISKVDKDNQLITLTDSEGKERFISPREASAEGVTLYRQEKITVSQGTECASAKVTRSAAMWPTVSGKCSLFRVTVSRCLMAKSPVR